jgi:hypothetical protein
MNKDLTKNKALGCIMKKIAIANFGGKNEGTMLHRP